MAFSLEVGMTDQLKKPIIMEEDWRRFFMGLAHQQISLALTEAYAQLFKVCVDQKLILRPKDEVSQVSHINSKDLSETTSLIYLRFESVFLGHNGLNKKITITQMLNHSLRVGSPNSSLSNRQELRAHLQQARELDNISNILKLGRNLNAHVQNKILDVGLTLQVCASVLRLFEIFDFERVKMPQISEIQSLAENTVRSAFAIVTSVPDGPEQKFTGLVPENNKHKLEESYAGRHVTELAKLEKESQGENEDEDEDEDLISYSVDEIPLDGGIKSTELKRQKLEVIKATLIEQLKHDGLDFKRKDLLLYGSNLTDILRYQPKCLDEIRNVLSVQFLISKNPEFVELQLSKIGAEIVSIFK